MTDNINIYGDGGYCGNPDNEAAQFEPETLTMQETLVLEKYEHNKHCFINLNDGRESGVCFTLQELVQLTKLVNE